MEITVYVVTSTSGSIKAIFFDRVKSESFKTQLESVTGKSYSIGEHKVRKEIPKWFQ